MSLPAVPQDQSSFAAAAFLTRYREPTLTAYRADLRCFWQWCAEHDLQPLAVRRAHLELYLRALEDKGYAAATIRRRISTVSGLFKYAVIDELISSDPTVAVERPRVNWEAQHRTELHPLAYAAVLRGATAQREGARSRRAAGNAGVAGM